MNTNKTCPNCGSRITCGCQRRVAKDGTKCCSKCVTTVNINYIKSKTR